MEISEWAVSQLKKSGLKVGIKTTLGPELQLYDSRKESPDTPEDEQPGILSQLFMAGLVIRDNNGKVLANLGQYPKTNPVAVALVVGVGGFLLYRIMRRCK